VLAVYWNGGTGLFQRNGLLTSPAGVLVLEDSDSDFRTPPFEDEVIMFGPNGKAIRKVTGLNICETVGACRSLSVARDGRFLTVCENVGQKLAAYELKTGERLWSMQGEFNSATVAPNNMVYALTSHGTIYGEQTLMIDQTGQVVRQAAVRGFDLVMDADRNVLWLVGKNVKKCDLELNILMETNLIGWCAVSVDLDRDGAVWVAERQHPNVTGSTDRILRISPTGKVLKTVELAFSPLCLRVDRSDGGVWVTGVVSQPSLRQRLLEHIEKRTGHVPTGRWLRDLLTRPRVWSRTDRYDRNGALQCEIEEGGFSLDIDPADGSLWIGGRQRVYHYSRQGAALGRSRGASPSQKYVAVVPGDGQQNEQPVQER
jgi:hypothetical protein